MIDSFHVENTFSILLAMLAPYQGAHDIYKKVDEAKQEFKELLFTRLPELTDDEKQMLTSGKLSNRIEVIKTYRVRTGATLRESKDKVDAVWRQMR